MTADTLIAPGRPPDELAVLPIQPGVVVCTGQFIFRWRDLLFPAVALVIGFGTSPVITAASMPLDHAVDAVGILVSLGGQVWRILVIGLVYITRGGQNRQIWANALVEEGVFAHCRNPLYLGNLLIVAGLAIVHGGWAMYLVTVPFFALAYSAVVRAEESYLRGRFGDAYATYCERVPRWWPLVRGLAATWRSGRFDWLKVLRKEYGTPFGWLSGTFLLLLWEHRSPFAMPLDGRELGLLAGLWTALAIAYVVARVLKLRGLLGSL